MTWDVIVNYLYALTLKPILMPWWGWIGLDIVALYFAYETLVIVSKVANNYEDYKKQCFDYVIVMTFKHLGLCGCKPWPECKIHGNLEFQIEAEPKVKVILEAADEHHKLQMAQRFRKAQEEASFLDKEADKRKKKELAEMAARQEAEARDAVQGEIRDRLAQEHAEAREREILAHAAAEEDRERGNEFKDGVWKRKSHELLPIFFGTRNSSETLETSSPPPSDGESRA